MMYEDSIKHEIVGILEDRISTISDCIAALYQEGFIPNKNKITILDWSSILIHAYENIEILNNEQRVKLDSLYNKVRAL